MTNIAGSFSYIQQESFTFNNPVSEASLNAVGASINGLLSILMPVGSVVHSMLTEAQFQTEIGNPNPATWVLADGRDVTGSLYNTITGNTTIPDLRAIFLRGKDNGRGLDPNGDLTLGTYVQDQLDSHNHGVNDPQHSHSTVIDYFGPGSGTGIQSNSGLQAISRNGTNPASTNISIQNTGGSETAPKLVVVNILIRIN